MLRDVEELVVQGGVVGGGGVPEPEDPTESSHTVAGWRRTPRLPWVSPSRRRQRLLARRTASGLPRRMALEGALRASSGAATSSSSRCWTMWADASAPDSASRGDSSARPSATRAAVKHPARQASTGRLGPLVRPRR